MVLLVQTGVRAEEVRQAAEHTLFVEGRSEDGLDVSVLSELLWKTKVVVRPMGPSYHIKSTAQALHPYHPNYYFLIDRDYHDDNEVESSWKSFPNPSAHNLIIWKRRELENYFLIPEYFVRSSYATCTVQEVQRILREEAHKRVYMDAANLAIIHIRQALKEKWIELFDSITGFETESQAQSKLIQVTAWENHRTKSKNTLKRETIERFFRQYVNTLLGGEPIPTIGKGQWMELMAGKVLFNCLLTKCIKVRDNNGVQMHGDLARREFVRELLRLPNHEQPDDFRKLYELVNARVASA